MNPISLLWWVVSNNLFLAGVGVAALGVILAVVVFGGGWS